MILELDASLSHYAEVIKKRCALTSTGFRGQERRAAWARR